MREHVYRLRRLRSIDERPILLDDAYLATSRFPDLAGRPSIAKSLVATLRESYSTSIVSCVRRLEVAEVLCPDIAEQLQIPIMSPILMVRAIASGEDDIPVVYIREYIREGVSSLAVARRC